MARWTNGKLLEVKYDGKGPYVESTRRPRSTSTKEPEADVGCQRARGSRVRARP